MSFFKNTWFFCAIFVVLSDPIHAQEGINNVQVQIREPRIYVYYDLLGKGKYEVRLFVSMDGVEFQRITDRIKGDVGRNITAGKQKIIVWDSFNSYNFESGNTVFEVRAIRKQGRGLLFWGFLFSAVGSGGYWIYSQPGSPQNNLINDNSDTGVIVIESAIPKE